MPTIKVYDRSIDKHRYVETDAQGVVLQRPSASGYILRAVTPSDSTDIANCAGVRADAEGVIAYKRGSENTVTVNVLKGEVLPVASPFRIMAATTVTVHGFFTQ